MARSRNIKPGFFTNDDLAELPALTRLLFIGLWCIADREGRLEDKPKRIKVEVLPYDDTDVDAALWALAKAGFLVRYQVNGARFIQIANFTKHQNPHVKEAESSLPAPESPGASMVQAGKAEQPKPERATLIPDSGFLIPDSPSLIPDSKVPAPTPAPDSAATSAANPLHAATWKAYAEAYALRYAVEPVRNAAVNSQIKQLVQRLGAEAPDVARFYLKSSKAYYVQQSHAVGPLLKDAEGLRTQWATGRTVTVTAARQADATQARGNVFHELIEEANANAA